MIKVRVAEVQEHLQAVLAVLFLFSPIINYYLAYYSGVPLNSTAPILALFTISSVAMGARIDSRRILFVGVSMIFVAYCAMSTAAVPFLAYPMQKFFLTFAHIFFVLLLVLYASNRLGNVVGSYLYMAAIISFFLFKVNSDVILGAVGRERDLYEGVNASVYLSTGFLIGLAALHYLAFSAATKGLKALVTLGAFVAILYTGARGPLIFLSLCVFLIFLIGWTSGPKFRSTRGRVLIGFIGVAIFFLFIYHFAFKTQLFWGDEFLRAYSRLAGLGDLASTGRLKHLDFVLDSDYTVFQVFFGRGFGSYGYFFYGVDAREYPHNLLLELWYELGVVGLALFFALLFILLQNLKARNIIVVIFFSYSFFELMKSSTFSDFRPFWFCYALVFVVVDSEGYSNGGSRRLGPICDGN